MGVRDAPSSEFLQKAFPKLLKPMQKINLPLAVKNVDVLDYEMVARLSSYDPRPLQFFKSMIPYLYDESLYAHVPEPGPLKYTGFRGDEERMMETHKFVLHYGDVLGTVYGFKVAQFFKGNFRPVWSCYIRDFFKKQLPHYHLQTARNMARRLFALSRMPGTIFVQFDFKAFYDQFPLSKGVQGYFCFRGRNDRTYALTRLPMGFNLACAIAQSTTWQLLNFQKRSSVFTCIDNVAFAGTVDDVVHDVRNFLARCDLVGATLNELTPEFIKKFLTGSDAVQRRVVESLHQDDFTFLGVRYQWANSTKCLSDKTRGKLQAIHHCVSNMPAYVTPRQLASVFGVLRYSSAVLDKPSLHQYDVLAWARRLAHFLQCDLTRWDTTCIRFPMGHRMALLEWIDEVLDSAPVPYFSSLPVPVPPTIVSDASGNGWGAILIDKERIAPIAGKWRVHMGSSVQAEPQGVLEAALALFPDGAPPVVSVLVDHLPLVYAANSLAPRAYSYNSALLELKDHFPSTRFVFSFLPGRLNLADGLSRGVNAPLEYEKARDVAGTGWCSALTNPYQQPACAICHLVDSEWQC